MVIMLFIAVSVTERAVFPFARCVTKLEVGPPGQAAKIITPIAISLVTSNSCIKPKAIQGNKTIWFKNPKSTAFGYCKTRLKSFFVKLNPIPIIIMKRDTIKNIFDPESMKIVVVYTHLYF